MKMKYNKIFCLVALAGVLAGCDPDKLEIAKSYPDSEIQPPVGKPVGTIEMSQANFDNNGMVTFEWHPADFGMKAALDYALYLTDNASKDIELAANLNDSLYQIDYQSFYNRLIGKSYLGLKKGSSNDLSFYVTATTGENFTVVKSEPVAFKVNIARISNGFNMLYLVGDFNDNNPDQNAVEEDSDGSKTYRGLVNMKNTSLSSTNFHFVEYTYSGKLEGDSWGDNGGKLAVGGSAINVPAGNLLWVTANLNDGSYSTQVLDGPVRLCGFNGGWWFGSNPELVYNSDNDSWECDADYSSGTFRMSINDNWGFTFGPKRVEDLTLSDGADIKIYHNDIAKKFVGGDANFKLTAPGKYHFRFYYESADGSWHLSITAAK